jgi:DNA-binding response OmpR family regulator
MSNPPKVLVVDDEPLIAMMVSDWLMELGCDAVGPAGRAEEAIPFIEAGNLDAVLLDVTLGTGDSFPIADAAMAKELPLAFVTGRSALDLPVRFKTVPVLMKPFQFEAVEALMAKLVKRAPQAGAGN